MQETVRAAFGPDTVDDVPRSAIFIDMPNVFQSARRSAALTSTTPMINWRALSEHLMLKQLVGTHLVHVGAYLASDSRRHRSEAERLKKLSSYLLPVGFDMVVRRDKDIDAWIINDIWHSVVKAEQDSIREHGILWYPLKMRHILVSGDGGYLRAYHKMKQTYRDHLELDLVVYSWKESLHKELASVANSLHYMDDIPGILDGYHSERLSP